MEMRIKEGQNILYIGVTKQEKFCAKSVLT